MIPLHDNLPTRRLPLVTIALIAINLVVFLVDRATATTVARTVPVPGGIEELLVTTGGLSKDWAMVPSQLTGGFAVAWPTVFTSMFLHGGWLHLGGNMLYLWIFGNNVEDTLGRARFVLFYLLAGVVGAAVHVLSGPGSIVPTVGASGAIAGVMGGYLILFPDARIVTLVTFFYISVFELNALVVIGFWALLQFLNANWLGGGGMGNGGVAYFAHIGGFVAGMVAVLLLGGRSLRDRPEAEWVN